MVMELCLSAPGMDNTPWERRQGFSFSCSFLVPKENGKQYQQMTRPIYVEALLSSYLLSSTFWGKRQTMAIFLILFDWHLRPQ